MVEEEDEDHDNRQGNEYAHDKRKAVIAFLLLFGPLWFLYFIAHAQNSCSLQASRANGKRRFYM